MESRNLDRRPPSLLRRVRVAIGLLVGLRCHDFRAARTFVDLKTPDQPWIVRWSSFLVWSLRQMFLDIPDATQEVTFARPLSRTPIWLADRNPWANHPWSGDTEASLPEQADTVVIGAGFSGGALAYHWSKQAPGDRTMVVLEMDDPASGSSGRNEGLVVMGRYFAHVYRTVLPHLTRVRRGLAENQQHQLARQFAAAYCDAAYKNADMIETTITTERFDCDYAREGWVQAADADEQNALKESVKMARDTGYTDWTCITPAQVRARSGMQVRHNAGFSLAAASFHPAKWVWSLFGAALATPVIQLFTRTKVLRVEDRGEDYLIHTSRGAIRTRCVVNATESYSPLLHWQLHDVIQPIQTQAASGIGGPESVKPHVGISSAWFFCGHDGEHMMFGSDATRVPDREAGRIQPSRFLTTFLMGELKRYFGSFRLHVTHEWSGTVGFTADEFPIVGLLDDKRQYIIGGMAGSGTAVSFNAARCICNRILGLDDECDDYPQEYFSPTRLLDPEHHAWPNVKKPTNGDRSGSTDTLVEENAS